MESSLSLSGITVRDSLIIFESAFEDESLKLVVVKEAILLYVHLIVKALDDHAVWNAQVVIDLRVAQLLARLDQVVLRDLATLLLVKVLEKRLHLLEVAAVHENGTDAAEELVKVHIFFLSFVKETKDALQNLRWVLKTEHLSDLDEVEALDAR